MALINPFCTTLIKRLICGARFLFPFEAGGRQPIARAQATMVAVGVVLTAGGVCVVGAVAKETAARREVVILVVEVRGAPVGAMTPTVASLTTHVVVRGIASETSACECSVDSFRGGEAVNRGLIASPSFGSTDLVAVEVVVVGTAVTVGATRRVTVAFHDPRRTSWFAKDLCELP